MPPIPENDSYTNAIVSSQPQSWAKNPMLLSRSQQTLWKYYWF